MLDLLLNNRSITRCVLVHSLFQNKLVLLLAWLDDDHYNSLMLDPHIDQTCHPLFCQDYNAKNLPFWNKQNFLGFEVKEECFLGFVVEEECFVVKQKIVWS